MKKRIDLGKFFEDKIKSYLCSTLDNFYESYIDYICGVAWDESYEVNGFAEGKRILKGSMINTFYLLYKYIKESNKIYEPFISHNEIIYMVEDFLVKNEFRGIKIYFEKQGKRDKNVDYELRRLDSLKGIKENDNTVIIEFMFKEEKHNFKIRKCSNSIFHIIEFKEKKLFDVEDLRAEVIFNNPLDIIANVRSLDLILAICKNQNESHCISSQCLTSMVELDRNIPYSFNFFEEMLNDSNKAKIDYYLEPFRENKVRDNKEIEDFTKIQGYESHIKEMVDRQRKEALNRKRKSTIEKIVTHYMNYNEYDEAKIRESIDICYLGAFQHKAIQEANGVGDFEPRLKELFENYKKDEVFNAIIEEVLAKYRPKKKKGFLASIFS